MEKTAEIYATVRRAGYTIGDANTLIAEYCLISGYTLVTNNSKGFVNISGLRLEVWSK